MPLERDLAKLLTKVSSEARSTQLYSAALKIAGQRISTAVGMAAIAIYSDGQCAQSVVPSDLEPVVSRAIQHAVLTHLERPAQTRVRERSVVLAEYDRRGGGSPVATSIARQRLPGADPAAVDAYAHKIRRWVRERK